MHRGELSNGRAFSGISLTGAIGLLVVPVLIAFLVIQLAGQRGRMPLAEHAGRPSAPQTVVAGDWETRE